MGILSGNQKEEPLHYGEVASSWTYLSGIYGTIAGYQTFINHTGDEDLKKFIEDMIQNEMKPQANQLEELLKANGIALPPAPPERPHADLNSIPAGARFTDPEIAMTIAKNIATGLVTCSKIMGSSTREDVAMMFGQFHVEKATYGLRLLRIQKEKGWLAPPPLHKEVPELAHT